MSEFQQHPAEPQGGIATQPQSPTTARPTSSQLTVSSETSACDSSVGDWVAEDPSAKRQEVCRFASELFAKSPDWVTFFREILGVEGIARRIFSKPGEMAAFEQTEEYAKIQGMVAKLREQSRYQWESNEPTRVITVRLPKSLHEFLKAESYQRRTSMNQLCISKLLQIIDSALVPAD